MSRNNDVINALNAWAGKESRQKVPKIEPDLLWWHRPFQSHKVLNSKFMNVCFD